MICDTVEQGGKNMRNHLLLILIASLLTVFSSCHSTTAFKTVKVPYLVPVYETVQVPYEEPVFAYRDVPYGYVYLNSVTIPFLKGDTTTNLGTYNSQVLMAVTKIGTEKIQTGIETKYRSERVQSGVETKYHEERVSYEKLEIEWDKVGTTTLGTLGGAAIGLYYLSEIGNGNIEGAEQPIFDLLTALIYIVMGGYFGYEYGDIF
jgi:hypothetical protein